jgi:hypothetical protein
LLRLQLALLIGFARYKASLRLQRVADQAQAARTEATEALSKESALRGKLDLLCKELQKRNLEMKVQLAKQQEEQLKTHQGALSPRSAAPVLSRITMPVPMRCSHAWHRHAGNPCQHLRRHQEHE